MNQLKTILLLITIVATSCNDESNIETPISESNFDIESINLASKDEVNFVSKSLSGYNKGNGSNFNVEDFTHAEVVIYSNLPGKTFVLNSKQNSNLESSSLIIVLGSENEIISILEHSRSDKEASYSVSLKQGSFEFFSAEVEKNSDTILSYEFHSHPSARTFEECLETAISACAGDGECAFLCGIIWQYCIGAIVTACAVHAVT